MKYCFVVLFSVLIINNSFSQNLVKIKECALVNGQLKDIEVDYNPATGDKTILVGGVRKDFSAVYPKNGPDYAEGQSWFINNEPVKLGKWSYVKYGLPRVLSTTDITKQAAFKGVGIYIEAGLDAKSKARPEVIYIPVRQGCEFQPYQINCGDATIEKVSFKGNIMVVKAKVTGLTGKISYEWSSNQGKIIKGQGTSIVTLDLSEGGKATNIDVRLVAKDAQNCPVHEVEYFGWNN